MIRILLVAVMCLLCNPGTLAQSAYAVQSIAPNLIENANVVKRLEEVQVEIKDIDKAVITTRYVLTILNEGGDDYAAFVEGYSKLISLKDISGTLYNANGKKIRSLKKSEVMDMSATDDSNLADDERLKTHNFNCNIYPYTVEYESEKVLHGIFYLPNWIPVAANRFSVEKSFFKVSCPADYKLRYKSFNYAETPLTQVTGKSISYEWKVQNIAAFMEEKYAPAWHEITTSVFLAPTDFVFQDYKGSMSDWKQFGKFIYDLNEGRDQLPETVRQRVHELTDGLTDRKAKIKALYEFMQGSTHYVSVQMGIGGWQTYDAKYVAANGYGDCKALSNYMYSLLKEAGIQSYYTLIESGKGARSFIDNFPSNQFNHIILCVPTASDTTWLECTNQTMPAGYLGESTSNRPALLVDKNGGIIARTPAYTKSDNLQIRKISGTLNSEGRLSATSFTRYRACLADPYHSLVNYLSKEKIMTILKEQIELPSYDVEKFDYREIKSSLPEMEETLDLVVNNFGVITGKRLFLSPNLLNKSGAMLNTKEERHSDINISLAYTDIDTVEINIPAGYVIESIPEGINTTCRFGVYRYSISFKPGKLTYIRYLERNSGRFSKKDYTEMAGFFKQVYKADRERVVLVKNN